MNMFKKQPKEPSEVQPIIDFIKAHPHEFEISEHTLTHKKSELQIWIANAPDHYGFYSSGSYLSCRGYDPNKFAKKDQPVFHEFITGFLSEQREKIRKEKVANKIKMLTTL